MKFAVAGLLVLAVSAQCGVLPLAYTSTAWGHAAPLALSAPITQYSTLPLAYHAAPAISYAAHVAAPQTIVAAPHTVYSAPHHAVVAAPHAIVTDAHAHVVAAPHAHVVAVPAAATYTAATRGAVHTAPLEGHAVSQTSLNLAPAPGTH